MGTVIKPRFVGYSSELIMPAEASVKVIVTGPIGEMKEKHKLLETQSK